MKTTGLAVLAALIASTNAVKFSTPADAEKNIMKGEATFFKHPTTGKPYISVKAKFENVEKLDKEGIAICYDFSKEPDSTEDDVVKGKGAFPISFIAAKDATTTSPKGYASVTKTLKDCTVSKVKAKDPYDYVNVTPN